MTSLTVFYTNNCYSVEGCDLGGYDRGVMSGHREAHAQSSIRVVFTNSLLAHEIFETRAACSRVNSPNLGVM